MRNSLSHLLSREEMRAGEGVLTRLRGDLGGADIFASRLAEFGRIAELVAAPVSLPFDLLCHGQAEASAAETEARWTAATGTRR